MEVYVLKKEREHTEEIYGKNYWDRVDKVMTQFLFEMMRYHSGSTIDTISMFLHAAKYSVQHCDAPIQTYPIFLKLVSETIKTFTWSAVVPSDHMIKYWTLQLLEDPFISMEKALKISDDILEDAGIKGRFVIGVSESYKMVLTKEPFDSFSKDNPLVKKQREADYWFNIFQKRREYLYRSKF